MKRVLIITGPPGIGKTSTLTKTVHILELKGFRAGGMLSREIRQNGVRVGFEIQDLGTGRHDWLAHISQRNGPRIGKYRVNLANIDAIGSHAIVDAVEKGDIVVIDEIGPMELFSKDFRDAVETALKSAKTVIAVVHWKVKDELINKMKLEETKVFTVTLENRDRLDRIIAHEIS